MNAKRDPFDTHHERYESWFTHHPAAYQSELSAVRALLPGKGRGLEIGVGTGRFAGPLGIKIGIDPSKTMLGYTIPLGILGVQGIAEALPFKNATFDFALVVTTICFVDDPKAMLLEARRVLKPGGLLLIGFVDRDSALGRYYVEHKEENVFYREAIFYSASEVETLLTDEGFGHQTWVQTLSKPLNEIQEIEPFHAGRGRCGFVVVSAAES